jgi:O-antigen/teichoic acid export membrane protein
MSSNVSIAKNTFFLFLRQFLALIVGLYGSRIVLKTLGVEDFGIYNLIGSVIGFLTIFSSGLTAATQRFLSFELGKGKDSNFNKVFNMSLTSYAIICIVILLMAETIGLYVVNYKLNVPVDRLYALNTVYQTTIFMLLSSLFKAPYEAAIIAYENMKFYAYLSIFEAAIRLIVILVLPLVSFDLLIFYAILNLCVSLIIFFIYKIYSVRKLSLPEYVFYWDKDLFNQIFSFSGWTVVGGLSTMGTKQGMNIFFNLFFGVALNAALGLAYSLTNAVQSLLANFTGAYRPQIVKLYASKRFDEMNLLINRTSKFSFFLFLVIALPAFVFTEELFVLWLGDVPEYTVSFGKLLLIPIAIDALQGPISTAVSATGRIKIYQIWQSALFLLTLPIAYSFLYFGFGPNYVLIVWFTIGLVAAVIRTFYLQKLVDFFPLKYIEYVLFRVVIVSLLTYLFSMQFKRFLGESLVSLFSLLSLTVATVIVIVYFVGLNTYEQKYFRSKAQNILKKIT